MKPDKNKVDQQIRELRAAGLGYKRIGQAVGMSPNGVKGRIKAMDTENGVQDGCMGEGAEGALLPLDEIYTPCSGGVSQGLQKKTPQKRNDKTGCSINSGRREGAGGTIGNTNAVTHGGYAEKMAERVLGESSYDPVEKARLLTELSLQTALTTEDAHLKIAALESSGRSLVRAQTLKRELLNTGAELDQFREGILRQLKAGELTALDASIELEARGIATPRPVHELLKRELDAEPEDEEGGRPDLETLSNRLDSYHRLREAVRGIEMDIIDAWRGGGVHPELVKALESEGISESQAMDKDDGIALCLYGQIIGDFFWTGTDIANSFLRQVRVEERKNWIREHL